MNGNQKTKPDANPAAGPKQTFIQFAKFSLVGVMNTGVDFLVFTLLLWAGAHYLAAQPLSYGAGTLNSYIVNKLWTFRDRSGPAEPGASRAAVRAELFRFLLLNLGTLLLSVALLYLIKDGLGIPALPAKLLVTGFTVVANYAGSRLWVFRPAA